MNILGLFILIISLPLFATSEISLVASSVSNSLEGTHKVTEDQLTLKSADQVSIGINYKWFLNSRIHLLFALSQEKFDFDIDDSLVEGDTSIETNEFQVGVRIVVSPKMAFSLVSKQKQDIGFKINSSGLVEIFSEELNILNLQYNQVLVQFRPFNFGFDVFYDFEVNGSDIEKRTSYGARLYSVIGRGAHRVRLSAGQSIIEKESTDTIFYQKISFGSLEYLFRF